MGILYWITGLPGAGKTTIAERFYKANKARSNNCVFLDGDEMRRIFGKQNHYSTEDRKSLAMQYARLCKHLVDQGLMVICATVSMYDSVRDWCRHNIESYVEVYIKVPLDLVKGRDQKQLYSKAALGDVKHVPGVDLQYEEPKNPDILLNNDGSSTMDDLYAKFISGLKEGKEELI